MRYLLVLIALFSISYAQPSKERLDVTKQGLSQDQFITDGGLTVRRFVPTQLPPLTLISHVPNEEGYAVVETVSPQGHGMTLYGLYSKENANGDEAYSGFNSGARFDTLYENEVLHFGVFEKRPNSLLINRLGVDGFLEVQMQDTLLDSITIPTVDWTDVTRAIDSIWVDSLKTFVPFNATYVLVDSVWEMHYVSDKADTTVLQNTITTQPVDVAEDTTNILKDLTWGFIKYSGVVADYVVDSSSIRAEVHVVPGVYAHTPQFVKDGWGAEVGDTMYVSFEVRGSMDSARLDINTGPDDWKTQHRYTIDIEPIWSIHEVEFVVQHTDSDNRFDFNVGWNTGWVELRNVSLRTQYVPYITTPPTDTIVVDSPTVDPPVADTVFITQVDTFFVPQVDTVFKEIEVTVTDTLRDTVTNYVDVFVVDTLRDTIETIVTEYVEVPVESFVTSVVEIYYNLSVVDTVNSDTINVEGVFVTDTLTTGTTTLQYEVPVFVETASLIKEVIIYKIPELFFTIKDEQGVILKETKLTD